jgi:hypothetical protein
MRYDPNEKPDPGISLDHTERIDLVAAYHREAQLQGDVDELHIAVHVAIEDHIACGPTEVSGMLIRLMDEGLSRHDADRQACACSRLQSMATYPSGLRVAISVMPTQAFLCRSKQQPTWCLAMS